MKGGTKKRKREDENTSVQQDSFKQFHDFLNELLTENELDTLQWSMVCDKYMTQNNQYDSHFKKLSDTQNLKRFLESQLKQHRFDFSFEILDIEDHIHLLHDADRIAKGKIDDFITKIERIKKDNAFSKKPPKKKFKTEFPEKSPLLDTVLTIGKKLGLMGIELQKLENECNECNIKLIAGINILDNREHCIEFLQQYDSLNIEQQTKVKEFLTESFFSESIYEDLKRFQKLILMRNNLINIDKPLSDKIMAQLKFPVKHNALTEETSPDNSQEPIQATSAATNQMAAYHKKMEEKGLKCIFKHDYRMDEDSANLCAESLQQIPTQYRLEILTRFNQSKQSKKDVNTFLDLIEARSEEMTTIQVLGSGEEEIEEKASKKRKRA